MKQVFLFALMMVLSLVAYAQNPRIVDFSNGLKYVVMDVEPVSSEYQNVKIYLKGNKLEDFIYDLEQRNKKVGKWTKTAKEENVTDYEQKMSGATQFSYMTLDYEGKSYWIEGAATGEGSWLTRSIVSGTSETGRPYCQSKFVVDKTGNCFLVFFSLMEPQKFKYGNLSTITETTVNAKAMDNQGNKAAASATEVTETQAIMTLQPEFYIFIPAENINSLKIKLQEMFDELKASKKEQKAKKKLFK